MPDIVIANRNDTNNLYKSAFIKRGVIKKVEVLEGINTAQVMLVDWGIELPKVEIPSSIAHKNTGVVNLPSVDDEVLIGFIDNNISSPVILGSLYNADNPPPLKVDDKNTTIKITLPAGKASDGKKGMEIDISCESNKQKVTIKTQKEHIIEFDDDKEKGEIKSKDGKNSFTIDIKNGKIELKAEKDIVMSAGNNKFTLNSSNGAAINCQKGDFKTDSQNIKQNAKSNAEIKANAKAAMSGANIEIKANAAAKVQASGMMEIKGSMTKIN